MTTWYADRPEPTPPRPRGADWLWVVGRGTAIVTLMGGGLAVLLLLRLVERPLAGQRRPITPHVTQTVCRGTLRILGLRIRRTGRPVDSGAAVANHSSWLDILVLNACARVTFLSKAEVARWPGIGWLARATGTLFIDRDRRQARAHADAVAERLDRDELLLMFPEGTSTDGRRVLPFKTTLFEAFLTEKVKSRAVIQPVSVRYLAPEGAAQDAYGWWGDMPLGPHLLAMLALRRHGSVQVTWHAPIYAAEADSRKSLAAEAERQVRAGFDAAAPAGIDAMAEDLPLSP